MLMDQTELMPAASPVRDLVAEANHRIANSLAALAGLVQQQIAALQPERREIAATDVRFMLGELRARVDAVAQLHRALSDLPPGATMDVGNYLQRIAAELVATLAPPNSVTLHFVCELGCHVAPEKALYLGLVAVELVTNSLKYAHPTGVKGKISIRCWRIETDLIVEIADDGMGFPDGFNPEKSPSGLRIVRSLVQRIGGTTRFASDDLGVTCTVQAPIIIAARKGHTTN